MGVIHFATGMRAVLAIPMKRLTAIWIPVAALLWSTAIVLAINFVVLVFRRHSDALLFDFNVYWAGARDFVERDLYRAPLMLVGHHLPIGWFNYPPLAAAVVAPLLPFGRESAGLVFMVASSAGLGLGLQLSFLTLDPRRPWLWAGLLFAGYFLLWPYAAGELAVANNSQLVFLLVAGFAAAHASAQQRLAGVLLAMATGMKLWPIVLILLIARERRWTELRWGLGGMAVQAVVFLAWLGPDVVGPMASAILGQNVAHPDAGNVAVLWTTWARTSWAWWPMWGTYVVAGALLAIPATGRLGLGLGLLGGLSLNANLWHHYAPFFLLAFALMIAAVVATVRQRHEGVDVFGRERVGRLG